MSRDLLDFSNEPRTQNGAHEEDEEEEELSVREVVDRMEKAWLNERFAPSLLPPQTQLVECLKDQMKQVESNLQQVLSSKSQLRRTLY